MLLPGRYKGNRKRLFYRPRTLKEIIGEQFKLDPKLLSLESEAKLIDRSKYAGEVILRYDDFKDGQVVTIDWFVEIKTPLRDRGGVQPALKLNEFEEGFLPLNTTNLDAMIEKFGQDEEKWKGKKVRIRIINTQTPNGKPAKGIRIE